MELSRIALNDMGTQGRMFSVSDERIWTAPLKEYQVSCRIAEPVRAEVLVLPQEDGCLLRGTLKGVVAMPCDRCMEETLVTLDLRFDEFERYPAAGNLDAGEDGIRADILERSVIEMEGGAPFLNLEALLWEEFSLALPVKPLCRPDCRGLCPVCGKNLNEGPCGCSADEGDPRLAVLRQLKVKR